MHNKKKTEDYVAQVAKEHGITKKAARQIITFGMKNICRLIARGEDIQLQHFGSFYFEKRPFSAYQQKIIENSNKPTSDQTEELKPSKDGENHND